MAKGISVKFKSFRETIPKLLDVIKFSDELKKHSSIILKPSLRSSDSVNTPVEFTEAVLRYCLQHKSPESQVLIAEGSDGQDTLDVFEKSGYRKLSENYSIGLVDLNSSEVEEIQNGDFLKFQSIQYPKVLKDAFIVSLPRLSEDSETEVHASLSNMLGAFPSDYYSGFFSVKKNKIRKHPIKYSIHDILKCKMPDFTIIDASEKGVILAGQPLEMDKQAVKLLGKDWKSVYHIKLADDSFNKDNLVK